MKRLCYVALTAMVVLGMIASPVIAKADKGNAKTWLGIYTQKVDDDLAEAFDLPVKHGVIVNQVVEGSPADRAGLKEDDVIIRLDGSKIAAPSNLVEIINDHRPGDEVTLTVMREDKELKLTATLKKRPRSSKRILISNDRSGKSRRFSFDYNFDFDSQQPYIGVSLFDLTPQLGDYFGVDKDQGALVTEVLGDSPAEEAGLKAGDVIVAIDDDEVLDVEDIRDLIADKEPGDKVEVKVVRNKKEKRFTVAVAEGKGALGSYSYRQFCGPDNNFALQNMLKGMLLRVPFAPDFPSSTNQGQYQKEMKKLKKQLKSLQEEMQELRDKLE